MAELNLNGNDKGRQPDRRFFVAAVIVGSIVGVTFCASPFLLVGGGLKGFFGDGTELPDAKSVQLNDASRLNPTTVHQSLEVLADRRKALHQARAMIERARDEDIPVAISGARNSMGGQALCPDGVVIGMYDLAYADIDFDRKHVSVGAGTSWADVVEFLDKRRRTPVATPSDPKLTVAGTISVNSHGWRANAAPIASTVKEIYVLKADSDEVVCSRTINPELFSAVLGGYGLFGVITRVHLETQNNERYKLERFVVDALEFGSTFQSQVRGRDDVGLAFARLSIVPDRFLTEAVLNVFRRSPCKLTEVPSLDDPGLLNLKEGHFVAAGAPTDLAEQWELEKSLRVPDDFYLSRNRVLLDGIEFIERTAGEITSIYHEYFIPVDAFDQFLDDLQTHVPASNVKLVRATVRHLLPDTDTVLRYADQEMFSIMLLFDQDMTAAGEADMRALSEKLIDAALALGGRHHLPFRLHATDEQFERAYPMADDFFKLKEKYDEDAVFQNYLYLEYGAR